MCTGVDVNTADKVHLSKIAAIRLPFSEPFSTYYPELFAPQLAEC